MPLNALPELPPVAIVDLQLVEHLGQDPKLAAHLQRVQSQHAIDPNRDS